MGFEVIGFQKIKAGDICESDIYKYTVKGDKPWEEKDIIPFMNQVASQSTDYRFNDVMFEIYIHGENQDSKAKIRVEKTLIPNINIIKVIDCGGIGKQMIDKFVRGLEAEVKK